MCGIVGYIGSRPAVDVLLPALKRLEYRGYDSAGIAALNGAGVEVRRAVGKLANLARRLADEPVDGTIGIGHTRWATHGKVCEENAHPHRAGRVALIHNGIIENYVELRAELAARGRQLRSQTDSEVIAHLIDEQVAAGAGLLDGVRLAIARLQGSFALVALSDADPNRLVAAKTATPIVLGLGRGESFVASDVPALLDHTREVMFLEDGELAEVRRDGVSLFDFSGKRRNRSPRHIAWDALTAQKGGHRHFLIKEISEQPQAIRETLRGRLTPDGEIDLHDLESIHADLGKIERVAIAACGTAYHAGLVGRCFLNELAGLGVDVEPASELRYRKLPLGPRDLFIAVSQSGETADTMGALERAKTAGARTLAICNVVDSSIARRADAVLYTQAGPEISVCSTKAFTTQLAALLLLALWLGRRTGRIDEASSSEVRRWIPRLPTLVADALRTEESVRASARALAGARDALFLGRGVNHPIALEGALKLKEISYIHAEGYPAGEMKHGPIALVTEDMPVVTILPHDTVYPKMLSNLKEVESRGGRLVAISDAASDDLLSITEEVVVVPAVHPLLTPFVTTIPLQLLAYHAAVARGTDVDQPRNLAKSVTVE